MFDLDDTIIRWIHPHEEPGFTQIIPEQGDILGYRYRVIDGAPELLLSIVKDIPDAKIAFFSGGSLERNETVLKQLRLPNGQSAWDIALRVFSRQDIVQTEAKQNSFFDGQKKIKKDLSLFTRDGEFNLDQIILVDDQPLWVAAGQERNLLWIGPKPSEHHVYYSHHKVSAQEFVQDRNKLIWVRGMIEKLLQKAKFQNISPVEALENLQWSHRPAQGGRFNQFLRSDIQIYREGLSKLRKHNAQFRSASVRDWVRCTRETTQSLIGDKSP